MTTTSDGPGLIVPLNVQALCFNANTGGENSFALAMADFSLQPYEQNSELMNAGPNLGSELLPTPFGTQALDYGVHLHWALPEALTRTSTGAGTPTDLWRAPNRWLIVRTILKNYASEQPALLRQAWVLESDRMNLPAPADVFDSVDTQPSPAMPYQPSDSDPDREPFRYMGQAFPLEGWLESTSLRFPLTSIGYGEPQFAAFYPNCQNVFGFHEPQSSLEAAGFDDASDRLSYFVAGWYSDQDQTGPIDPLVISPLTSGASNAMSWQYDSATNPSYTLCTGIVDNVLFNQNTVYWETNQSGALDIAVGNTAVEALSAWVAQSDSVPGDSAANVEKILNALQLGVLPQLSQADGPIVLDETLHTAGFGSLQAGVLWQVMKRPVVNGNVSPVIGSGNSYWQQMQQPAVDLPENLAASLDALNEAQLALERLNDQALSVQIQIFGDWAKLMQFKYPQGTPPAPAPPESEIESFIELELQTLATLQSTIVTQQASVSSSLSNTENALAEANRQLLGQQPDAVAGGPSWQFVLSQTAAPRYSQAANPVLLFHGADVAPVDRTGDLGAGEMLPCRTTDQVLTQLILQDTALSPSTFPVGIPAWDAVAASNLPQVDVFQNLLAEATLLNPDHANYVTLLLQQIGGDANPAVTQFPAVAADFQEAQTLLTTSDDYDDPKVGLTGTPPSLVAVTLWSGTPWLPVQLQWKMQFNPFLYIPPDDEPENYPQNFIQSTFSLYGPDDDNLIDLYPTAATAVPTGKQFYYHSTSLSSAATANLSQQIQSYLNTAVPATGNDTFSTSEIIADLQALADQVENLPILSQAIGGWNEALLMQEQVLQFQVSDPEGFPDDISDQVSAAVGNTNTVSPLAGNAFNPIRAGILFLDQLRLADAFGRIKEIDIAQDELIVSQALAPQNIANAPSGAIYLPPRITQPARLAFRWISADDDQVEYNSVPATSPIAGWVFPNLLDNSLMMFSADGEAIAVLSLAGNGTVSVLSAPSNPEQGTTVDAVFAGQNAHLTNLASALVTSADYFQAFLTALDQVVDTILPPSPQSQQALSLLQGRPLALARVCLGLELQGSPAANQSWNAFTDVVAAQSGGTPPPRSDSQFTSVLFPVWLGDLTRLADGLAGFFRSDAADSAADYATFYTYVSGGAGVEKIASDTLQLVADPAAAPTYLSLLIDPRAPVHATTGILPAGSLRIPQDLFAVALQQMHLLFSAAPILTPASSIAFPTPAIKGFDWLWNERAAPTAESAAWNPPVPVGPAISGAPEGYGPPILTEGWLSMAPVTSKPLSLNQTKRGKS